MRNLTNFIVTLPQTAHTDANNERGERKKRYLIAATREIIVNKKQRFYFRVEKRKHPILGNQWMDKSFVIKPVVCVFLRRGARNLCKIHSIWSVECDCLFLCLAVARVSFALT